MSGEAQLLRGVSHQEYHQDLLPGAPRLSRSIAVRLLQQSPLHAWAAHPKLGGQAVEEPEEDAQLQARLDTGSLLHMLLLGSGVQVAVVEADSWRTNAAKDAREEARSNGLLPVLAGKYNAAQATAKAIRESLHRYGVHPEAYEPEATALWDSGFVPSKARMDLLALGLGEVADLKIVDRISLRAFEAGVDRYGLDIQAAAYTEAVETCHPAIAGRVSFEFLLVERLPPHDVAIVPLSPSLIDLGAQKWRRARSIWARCLESGVWPGFGRVEPIEAKPWQLEAELVHMAAGSEAAFDKIAPEGAER